MRGEMGYLVSIQQRGRKRAPNVIVEGMEVMLLGELHQHTHAVLLTYQKHACIVMLECDRKEEEGVRV